MADFGWFRGRTASRLEWGSSARGSGYEDASMHSFAKEQAVGQAWRRGTRVRSSAWSSAAYDKGTHTKGEGAPSIEGDADNEDGNFVKDASAAETDPRHASGSW